MTKESLEKVKKLEIWWNNLSWKDKMRLYEQWKNKGKQL